MNSTVLRRTSRSGCWRASYAWHRRCGIAQSWLLYRAGEPVISAFYTMGHVETVQAETEDLEGIIASLDLLEVDPPSWAQ